MIKIIVVPDSFKGSATSLEVCNLIEEGILRVLKNDVQIKKIPIADGGEGTVETLVLASGGIIKRVQVQNPMGDIIDAHYGIINNTKAVIEMASASGLTLIDESRRNPLIASTYGTGELILDALYSGCHEILIGIGGSATNDFGIGMARALGYKFLDKNNNEVLPLAKNMINIVSIDSSNVDKMLYETKISVACDVANHLYGENGATAIYGPQKGVTKEMFDVLDNGLKNMSEIAKNTFQKDVANIKGAGAAGGLGAGLIAFCNANLKSGIDAMLDIVCFDDEIDGASLIITGEGAIDGQSKEGKVPVGIAKRASLKNIPVIAIVGDIRDGAESVYDMGIVSIMPALKKAMPLEEAMKNSHSLIVDATERAMRFISINL